MRGSKLKLRDLNTSKTLGYMGTPKLPKDSWERINRELKDREEFSDFVYYEFEAGPSLITMS